MKTDLVVKDIQNTLVEVKPEYKTMLKNIDEKMPVIQEASSNFHKSHSQFMGVTLDVTAITPVRSIKHTLAEVNKTKNALQEAHIRMQKKAVELKECYFDGFGVSSGIAYGKVYLREGGVINVSQYHITKSKLAMVKFIL